MSSATTMANTSFLSPDAAATHSHHLPFESNHNEPFDSASFAAFFHSDPSDPFSTSKGEHENTLSTTAFPTSSRSTPGPQTRSLTQDPNVTHHQPMTSPVRSNSAAGIASSTLSNGNSNSQSLTGTSVDQAATSIGGFFRSPLASSPVEDRQSPFSPSQQQQQTPGNGSPANANFVTPANKAFPQGDVMPNRSESMQSLSGLPPLTADDGSSPSPALAATEGFHGHHSQHATQGGGGEAGDSSPGDRSQLESDAAAEKRQSTRFVYKLMRMVSDPESQSLISFNATGTSVVVTNFDDFAKEVLPKHFKHSNFSSFIRQLNMYGFYKVNKTPRGQRNSADSQIWEFSHPKFIRGRYDLLDEIRRKALDTDHSRVEARADLQFNMSLGQIHIRQHLEEMQWRIDHAAEENRQLREFSHSMHAALVRILDYLKASNGGQLPFDVHLPLIDAMPSPMVHSPFASGAAWSSIPPQSSAPHAYFPQQVSQPHVYHQGGPSRLPHQVPQQQQQGRPSIFVTEPGQSVDPRIHHINGPPMSPHDNSEAFSMSGLQGVSPLASRRVSGSSSNHDRPDLSEIFDENGVQRADYQQQSERPQIASMPRRSFSGRNDLAIDTQLSLQAGEPGPLSTGNSLGQYPPSSAFSMPDQTNPGLGVMGGHPSHMSMQQFQHHQAGLLTTAVNTPLPPSPAIPSYHNNNDSPYLLQGGAAGAGRFPTMNQVGALTGHPMMSHTNSPNPNSGGFDNSPMIGGGGDSSFAVFMNGDDSQIYDSPSGPGGRPNAKAMRTPLKRTASNSAQVVAQAAAEAANGNHGDLSLGAVTKRKEPI
ncbi:unnamed protein product [Sympodiomycopsis kandeliae]